MQDRNKKIKRSDRNRKRKIVFFFNLCFYFFSSKNNPSVVFRTKVTAAFQVYPDGMISFSRPSFITPPFTFPNPMWPNERDASFIAAFRADAMFQYIGNVKISNTWFRSVHRRNVHLFPMFQSVTYLVKNGV